MLALVLDGRPRLVRDHPRPRVPGEVRIGVRLAGICGTDLQLLRGYMPFRGVLGHEFVGTLLEDGPWPAGTRVVGEINCVPPDCGDMDWHERAHHPARTVLGIQGRDGVFAEECTLPASNLHRVPDAVADEEAVFTEPLAAACRILEQIPSPRGQRALVLGGGRLGFLVAQVLATAGAEVVAADRHPEKLLALRAAGIAVVHSGRDALPVSLPLIVDCTGRPEGLALALERVAPEGTVVLKSTCAASIPVALAPVVVHEVRVLGSRCGPFAEALRHLEAGNVRTAPLVEARLPLRRGVEALARAGRPEARKILIDPAG